ncbi:MAG TPA: crotonase/enoyl-CoA hydratase family protein [Nocardioidaceae bacterium]|nr:crotonase/enoyl-CoA hydratase family protein [Nocardioidaceae bacterium]
MDARTVRKQLRSARATARWARQNPAAVAEIARGLLATRRGGAEAPAYDGDRVAPEGLDAFDRSVTVSTDTAASPEAVRAFLDDFGRLPDWMGMHAGWRGEPPAVAEEGSTFVQKVKMMGIPAEISWTVVQAGSDTISIEGAGPMGLVMRIWFSVQPAADGSRLWADVGLSGDPIKGPMGGSVAKNVHETMEASLARLAEIVATTEVGPAKAGKVLHHVSGRRLDPNTPVIVGAGQVAQRRPDAAKDPATLSVEALRLAEADSGVAGLLKAADSVYAVASASWTYRDQGALVAAAVGASPKATVQSARFGGDAGQVLINTAGEAIASGEASVVLVCGAEAGATLASSPDQPAWPTQNRDVKPTQVIGSEREANNDAESKAGLMAPIYVYALMEQAMRGKLGLSVDQHRDRITKLWSSLSEVAARNEHAWQPKAFSPEELGEPTEDNRLVSSPYTKLLCANLQVDLASGLILTSVAAAEAAGVPQEKWVFLHAGAAAYDEWFVSERGDLAASPAIGTIGKAALAHAGLTIDDIDHVDLYSCFPVAVQIAAAELGLGLDRPLSVTGGLTFAGGPGNNYGGHAVASLVQRLRQDPSAYGLSTSLGWYVTKHALGIYSAQPPVTPYRSLHPVVDPAPTRPVLSSYAGPAVVESYTVAYDRNGPEAAIVSAVTPDGSRVLLRSTQVDVIAELESSDALGWSVIVDANALAVTDRERQALPAVPEPTVLVENRGPVRIITLNRPHRRNAIDLPTAELLERVVDAFEADPTARVAVLTGAGGTFCAGMDLKAAAAGAFALTEKRGPLGIAGVPIKKPVIAAVEGHALAGGCELALVADLIVASTESEFGIPEPKRGLVAAAGGVLRLAQRLPRNIAMELALTGDPMPATRMAELGLVNRLADPGKALDVALELAEQIVANAPLSIEVSKEIIEQHADWSREEEFAMQSELAGRAVMSEDAGEGVRAFAEKRAPVWKGC